MARELTLTARLSIEATLTNATTNTTPTSPLSYTRTNELTTGTSADQADRLYQARLTLSTSGTTSLDLSGSLTDDLGQTTVFAKVKGIAIYNRETTAGLALVIGGNANPLSTIFSDASDEVKVGPGGMFLLTSPVDGYAVTAGTGDILDITNPSGSSTVSFDIVIWGTSA